MQTITGALSRTAQIRGGFVATNFNGVTRTWNELLERISRLAAAIKDHSSTRQGRIACLSLNSDRYYEYYLATSWAGLIFVPINTRLAIPEIVYWLTDSESELLFIDDNFLPMLTEIRKQAPGIKIVIYMGEGETPEGCLNYESMIANYEPVSAADVSEEAIAGIFYTGGTTGRSKGVMLSHLNLCFNAMQGQSMFNWSPDDHYLHAPPMFHMADGHHTMICTIIGVTNSFIPSFDPEATLQVIQQNKISRVTLVPTMISMLVNHPKIEEYDLSSLRSINYGASPMPEALISKVMDIVPGVELTQIYGQTEAAPTITILRPEYHEPGGDKLGSVGQAVPGVTLSIRDNKDKVLPSGSIGEICFRGSNIMKGYNNMPEVTEENIRDGWLHTGDSGYMDEDGFVFIVDRIKDMIISGGENVYSQETENAIYLHPAILECAVIGIPHDKWGEQVHAIVRLKPDQQLSEEELIEHCKSLIANYKCPRSVAFRETAFPLSGAGKILKNELRASYWEGKQKSVN